MNKTLALTGTTILLATLTACAGSSSSSSNTAGKTSSSDTAGKTSSSAPATSKLLTASTAFAEIFNKVTTAKLSGTVTAENDPNHLLGRPNQYTSKVTFTDTRIKASEVADSTKGSVDLGGAIEVFADPAAAAARAKYIQAVTKSLPALAEYDYVHGTVLTRVSHYLTPTQAGQYQSAANGLR